jgi:hypothetical protein
MITNSLYTVLWMQNDNDHLYAVLWIQNKNGQEYSALRMHNTNAVHMQSNTLFFSAIEVRSENEKRIIQSRIREITRLE